MTSGSHREATRPETPPAGVDEICDAFEAAWFAGKTPRIEEFLARGDVVHPSVLLRELLLAEWDLCRRHGQPVDLATYHARFPQETEFLADLWRTWQRTPISSIARVPLSQGEANGYGQGAPDLNLLCPHCQNQISLSQIEGIDVVCAECGSSFHLEPGASAAWQAGSVRNFGRFELIEPVGVGAFGTVYRARDPELDRTVAIKVPRTSRLADPEFRDRFFREARSVARLRHPSIVPVFEAGQHEGTPYLASEFVDGVTLADFISANRLPPRKAAELIAELAEALQYAHAQGVIHRDVKPSNVLLDAARKPHLMDFGLAKRDSGNITMTLDGQILGTPAYMSPEQARGEGHQVDGRTDVYSLGVILYQLLTGELPFRGTTRMLLNQVLHDEPRRPRSLADHLPRDLETICLRAMSKEPSGRYATAQDMADDLRRFLNEEPIHARPIGPVARAWRWCRRNPVVAGLDGLVLLLLIVVTVGSLIAAAQLKQEGDVARAAQRRAIASERARRQELIGAYLAEARSAAALDGPGQQLKGSKAIQDALRAVAWDDLTDQQQFDLIDAASRCLVRMDVRETMRRPSFSRYFVGNLRDVDIDGNFQYFARPAENHAWTVVESLDGAARQDNLQYRGTTEESTIHHTTVRQFSPRGNWLLEITEIPSESREGSQRIRVWDRTTHRVVFDRVSDGTYGNDSAFHPDERHLLITGTDGVLRLFDLRTGEQIRASNPRFRFARPAYSPDGTYLAIASIAFPAEIIDAMTWDTVMSLPGILNTRGAAWAADGKSVLFSTVRDGVYVQPLGTSGNGYFSKTSEADIMNMMVNPNGRLLATSGPKDTLELWDMEDDLMLMSAPGRVLRFSQDGKRLAAIHDGQLIIYDLAESQFYRTIRSPAQAAEFSQDGRWLGVSGYCGVQLFQAEQLTLAADLGMDFCGPVGFHPSGRVTTFGTFSQAWTWPLGGDEPNTIGPPWPVLSPSHPMMDSRLPQPQHQGRHAAWSADGSLLVLADYRNDKVVLVKADTGIAHDFAEFSRIAQVAISPDRRWVAGASVISQHVRVWNSADGSVALDLPRHSYVAFSHDGQWMATRSQSEVSLYRVPSWTCERVISMQQMLYHRAPLAFQPGGRLLAISNPDQQVQLYDRDSGRLVINLDDRETDLVHWLSFSPDGTRLAVTRADLVAVWDLYRLNQALMGLGLRPDGLPDGSSTRTVHPHHANRPLMVNRGSMRDADKWYQLWETLGRQEAALKRWPDAVDNLSKALGIVPAAQHELRAHLLTVRGEYYYRNKSYLAAREDWRFALLESPEAVAPSLWLARLSVFGPPEVRDPKQTKALANLFIGQGETDPAWIALLGMARVRLGESNAYQELSTATGHLAWRTWVLYFIALDHHQRNEPELAGEAFSAALQSHQEQLDLLSEYETDELDRLRTEVESRFTQSS